MARRRNMLSVAASAAVLSVSVAGAQAAYVQDFSATGSQATDFATIRAQNLGSPTVTESASGEPRLLISTNTASTTGSQVHYLVAPTNVDGAEVALPTGNTAAAVRTEARLDFQLYANNAGTVQPFTAFGFTAYDSTSALGTGNSNDKIIAQLNNTRDGLTLKAENDLPGVPTATLATITLSPAVTLPSDFRMEVTADQVRILVGGVPLTSTDTDAQGYVNHGLSLVSSTTTTGFTGDSLMPFFGVIRGATSFSSTTVRMRADIDNISATNVLVPEPASVSLLGLGAIGMLARRRRHVK